MNAAVSRARGVLTARPWLTVAVVVVVAGGVTAGYVFTGGNSNAQTQTGVTSRLVAATTGTVRQSVSTTGTLTPADEDDVSFSSSSQVTSVKVAVGDTVTKGEVLGTIDDLALKSALAQAQANLATAQAALASAQDSGTATTQQLDADEASVATAQSAVTAADTALSGATLRSPIAGTVATVNVAVGDMSGGSGGGTGSGSGGGTGSGSGGTGRNGTGTGTGSGTGTGAGSGSSSSSTADFVVVGLKQWTVSASVDDTEVGLIKKGDQVQLTTDSGTGLIFGTVSSVSVLASTSSGAASYPVTIAVTGSPSGLHDGESVTASIIYRQLTNVLTVPTAAVHTSSGSSYVYVNSGGRQVKRTVQTGLSSGGTTQITSGLSSGEQVYVQTFRSTGTGTSNNARTRTGGFFGGGGGGNFPVGGFGGFGGGGQVVRGPDAGTGSGGGGN